MTNLNKYTAKELEDIPVGEFMVVHPFIDRFGFISHRVLDTRCELRNQEVSQHEKVDKAIKAAKKWANAHPVY